MKQRRQVSIEKKAAPAAIVGFGLMPSPRQRTHFGTAGIGWVAVRFECTDYVAKVLSTEAEDKTRALGRLRNAMEDEYIFERKPR